MTAASLRLKPIAKQSLATVVMQRLIDYIEGNDLSEGVALPSQHELSRQLGVSRPVLREAMQALASVGLVEIRPGSGCYIRDVNGLADPDSLFEVLTHQMALEVLEARMVVEVELAGLAAERGTDSEWQAIDAILDKLRQVADRGDPTPAMTSEFHQALARAGHNTVLFRMAQMLTRARVAQGLRIEQSLPDITAGEYASHRRLADAIRSGEPRSARAAMREHLKIAHGWEDRVATLRRQIAS